MTTSIFKGIGVEVQLIHQDNFLKIKETLTRIGVGTKDKKLFQSCHILHKRDGAGDSKYAIVHFKEMFKLDGKSSNIDDADIQRRNAVAELLEEWNLINILYPDELEIDDSINPLASLKILSFKEKDEWELISKYQIGKKGNNANGNR